MDIWDVVEMRDSFSEYSFDGEEDEEELLPLSYEELIKALNNCKLLLKYKLPTPEQALKDLNRILNSQKVRVWRLIKLGWPTS